MMRRLLSLAVLVAACALADQWQVTAIQPVAGCNPVCNSAFDIGAVEAGGSVSLPFRLANMGAVNVTLYQLRADGAGFSASSRTQIPITIPPLASAPTAYLEFNIVFRPSCATAPGFASARLNINTTVYTVTATVTAGAASCMLSPLSVDPSSLDFGKAFRGASVAPRTVTVTNPNAQPVAIDTLSVSGQAFDCPECEPVTLEGNQSVTVTIGWHPTGTDQGTLTVNEQTVALSGTAVDPPDFEIVADRALASQQQAGISVKLVSAAEANGSGLLTLDFTGKGDTGRGFLVGDTLALSAPFTISEGQLAAPAITLQTGTTAGTLTLTAKLGGVTRQATFQIAPAAVTIDSVRASRGTNGVLISVTGFDNTRSVSQATFSFFDTSNRAIGAAIVVPVAPQFQSYFQNAGTGIFVLRASFPVTGDVTQIGSVAVSLTNSVGATTQPPTMLE